MRLLARNRTVTFPRRPLVMGIINVNDDSFSGDGDLHIGRSLDRAREMVLAGADLIDVGGESARTNRSAITEQEEIGRLLPFVERFGEICRPPDCAVPGTLFPPLLSINTWRAAVANAVLPIGGDILNDIGGLPTPENAAICASHGVALVIMHSVGEPKIPHTHVRYGDIMADLEAFFATRIRMAQAAGLDLERVILDPGIDFAKQRGDNLTIYSQCERLVALGRPLLLPVSRKTVIGEVLDLPSPVDRDAGTVACIVRGMLAGAQIFRVHNVRAAVEAVRTIAAIEQECDIVAPKRIASQDQRC